MEKVQGLNGCCPWIQWTLSMVSVDIVHGLSGYCPLTEWTLSMDWVDVVHGLGGHCTWTLVPILQPDNVHWVHGLSTDGKLNAWSSSQCMSFIFHDIQCLYAHQYWQIFCLHALCLSWSHKNKSYCFIYCAVVSLFIKFWKIITYWCSKCCFVCVEA